MKFMNEYDIERALHQFQESAVLRKAAQFLSDYRDEVNSHSDGWAYWAAPLKAAEKLMTLFDEPTKATEEDFRRALAPIRSFYTKRGKAAGMVFPVIRS